MARPSVLIASDGRPIGNDDDDQDDDSKTFCLRSARAKLYLALSRTANQVKRRKTWTEGATTPICPSTLHQGRREWKTKKNQSGRMDGAYLMLGVVSWISLGSSSSFVFQVMNNGVGAESAGR